jgi:hypothetical protein
VGRGQPGSSITSRADAAAEAAYWDEHLTDPDVAEGEVVQVEVARPLTSTFSLRLPAAELDAIRQAASKANVSVSEWVRTACAAALDSPEVRSVVDRAALQRLVERLRQRLQEESSELSELSRMLAS